MLIGNVMTIQKKSKVLKILVSLLKLGKIMQKNFVKINAIKMEVNVE